MGSKKTLRGIQVREEDHFDVYNPKSIVVVISGHSAAGKDTVIQRLKDRDLPIHFVVTATTRPRRKDEQHGVDYFFVSHDEFARMIEEGELIEYAIVYKDFKGVPKEQVDQALASGKDVVMRVDVQGAASIREIYPGALLIFLTAQDEQEFISRLTNRKSESPEELKLRIAVAREELKRIDEFDYLVVNRDSQLGETVDTIVSIINAEHHRIRGQEGDS
jgi:guanylate kinase